MSEGPKSAILGGSVQETCLSLPGLAPPLSMQLRYDYKDTTLHKKLENRLSVSARVLNMGKTGQSGEKWEFPMLTHVLNLPSGV